MSIIMSLCLFLLLWASSMHADESMTPAELDKWFEQDNVSSADDVSEGELRFITQKPDKPVLHSLNKLVIYPSSFDDGWVSLSQCYQNLDPVATSEVVYQYKSIRDLKITKVTNIDRAEIEGQSIKLTEVQKEAELCISARVRILYRNADGSYSLVNGPFHRKFLDGYFPYHLTLEVHYPASRLQVLRTAPAAQPGLMIKQNAGSLSFDGIFEGILNVEVVFQTRYQGN
ncbi:MAG: hypothetical protein HKM94_07865 [Halobacteria archaeon]|nr:hypothetical protein [Halobacteria archaeon]